MKKIFCVILVSVLLFSFGGFSYSAEHGGKEHGGLEPAEKEHGGVESAEKEHGGVEPTEREHGGADVSRKPSADEIRQAMREYVLAESTKTGSFDIYDNETKRERRLALIRIHERVGKTGDYYYSCADFRDLDSGEMLDLDLDVEDKNGGLFVVDVRIHKLDGEARYTYDENDNRIPVSE